MIMQQTSAKPSAEDRRRSAVALVKLLLKDVPDLLNQHRVECLKVALFKLTEAETGKKHRLRFQSDAARSADKKLLRHDHVFQRGKMVEELLNVKSRPEDVDKILDRAVGCVITKDEHVRLNRYNHKDGWGRYQEAGMVVIDTETGKPFEFPR
jgi:hypothetical protein